MRFEIAVTEGDQFDMSRIKLGLPGQMNLEKYQMMLRNMGRLGILFSVIISP